MIEIIAAVYIALFIQAIIKKKNIKEIKNKLTLLFPTFCKCQILQNGVLNVTRLGNIQPIRHFCLWVTWWNEILLFF